MGLLLKPVRVLWDGISSYLCIKCTGLVPYAVWCHTQSWCALSSIVYKDGTRLFSVVSSGWTRGKGHKLKYKKYYFT